MFQKTGSTATTRIAILSLLATSIIALSGCGSLWTKADSEHGRFVTGSYRGQENKTLAVLLPESGRFAGAAKVVRAGVVAAQEADPEGKWPKLHPYGSTPGSISALVRWVAKAARASTRLAIGLLQRPAVKELADATNLDQVTVAVKPFNFYQFSLAPEDEVGDVAAKVWGEDHRKALLLLYLRGKVGRPDVAGVSLTVEGPRMDPGCGPGIQPQGCGFFRYG